MIKLIANSAAWIALALIALAPLMSLAPELVGGAGGVSSADPPAAPWIQALSDGKSWSLVGRGAAVAGLSAALAMLAGAAIGIVGIPRRGRWLVALGMIPLIAPPTVYALGWNAFWPAPNSTGLATLRCAAVLGLALAPICWLAALAARVWSDRSAAEAARVAGLSRARRWLRIELPSMAPALLASGAAVFLLSLSHYEIPMALNFESLPERVHSVFQQEYVAGAAAALAIVPALLAAALGYLVWRRLGRFGAAPSPGETAQSADGHGWAPWVVWIGLPCISIAPAAAGLFSGPIGADAFRLMAVDLGEGLRDSLPPAVGGAAICLGLGWMLAGIAARGRWTGAAAICLALIPAAVAPAIIGMGMIRFWNRPWSGDLVYGRGMALCLAYASRYLAVAVLAILAGRKMLGRDFVDAARTAGLSGAATEMRLLAPALGGALAGIGAVCLALCMGELGATTLISAPGIELISHRLDSRIHIGPASHVAALSLLYGAAAIAIGAAVWMGAKTAMQSGRRAT